MFEALVPLKALPRWAVEKISEVEWPNDKEGERPEDSGVVFDSSLGLGVVGHS